MKQYLELLEQIKERGTYKPAARAGMPGTQSLFGYQFRHNLQEGFPLLTTKKMFWKGVVIELLWFLRGDTNIKYLVDNGVNIWNEDAYNYYRKVHLENCEDCEKYLLTFSEFERLMKVTDEEREEFYEKSGTGLWAKHYKLGDCGYQYGKVWRNWKSVAWDVKDRQILDSVHNTTDQIKNVINSLRNTPESRRHIVTAIDPAHETDLALYWCHAMFQFNCRPLTNWERYFWLQNNGLADLDTSGEPFSPMKIIHWDKAPKYYLDCQLYQRSADVFLGVPFNIASYALLTEIIAKMCNMIPGEFIHTFGDVHIYDNHREAVEEQLGREPRKLPKLVIEPCPKVEWENYELDEILKSIDGFEMDTFKLEGYDPHPSIKAELSTGLIK